MLSWLTIPLYAVRMGMEAQNAAALGFFRMAGANIPSSESNIEGAAISAPVLALTAARSGAKKRRASAHSTPKKRRQSLKGRHRR
jgi:hypothetical protein